MVPPVGERGPSPRDLLLVLVGLNVLWAPVNFWVKTAAGAGLDGVTLGAVRWGLLSLLIPALLLAPRFRELTRYRPLDGKDRGRALLIGAFLFAPAHLLYYTSLPRTSSVEGTVLLTTAPLWTTLLSVLLLGERADARRWVALGMAIAGAYVVAVGFALPRVEGSHVVGNGMFFGGVVLECLGGVLAAGTSRRSSGIGTLAWQIAGAVPTYALALLVKRPPLPHPGLAAWGAVGYLVLVSGVVTFSTWYVLTERAPLSLMVLPIGLQPPIAAALGYFLLREEVKPSALLGALLILLALAVGFRQRGRGARGPAPSG